MANKKKLADFLREVSEWRWDEFVAAEHDLKYSTTQSIVFALVRACAMESLSAFRTAIGRVDGKMVTPVQILLPKVYLLFPYASAAAGELPDPEGAEEEAPAVREIEAFPEPEAFEESPTKGFRETMEKMAELPREFPVAVIEAQDQAEKHSRNEGRMPPVVPKVKTVVVAHILKMAQERNLEAINEVFDQLDGKLVEKIKVGEDMYLTEYSSLAPPGATRNADGVYQIEAPSVQSMWRQKLDGTKGGTIEI